MEDFFEGRLSGAQRLWLAGIVATGVALRLWQYFGNPSFWLDEIALAQNILTRSLLDLLGKPLAFDQVAPPGFLAAAKAATSLFGPTELALRLVPLLCALASLPLFVNLVYRILEGWPAVFATGLFAFNTPLIFHGAELKQYSTDVTVCLVLTLAALGLRDEHTQRAAYWRAGLLGAIAVWFSQPGALMLAGLGVALAWIAVGRDGWPALRRVSPTLLLWAGGAATATTWSVHRMTPSTRAYMQRFWKSAFPALAPRSRRELLWLPNALLENLGKQELHRVWRLLFVLLILAGFAALWRGKREHALILLGPVGVALAAAAARQYPFAERTSLFLAPTFLLAAGAGAGAFSRRLSRYHVPVGLSLSLLALPQLSGFARNLPVYRREEARPLLARLAAHRRPGDALYVYYGAQRAFLFYAPQAGLEPTEAALGGCHRGDLRSYLREIDVFRGRPRVWVLFAHAVPPLERPTISAYLDLIGKRRAAFAAPGADLALYDLSDPERLAAVSAETLPVPPPGPESLDWLGCDNGPHSPPYDARKTEMNR